MKVKKKKMVKKVKKVAVPNIKEPVLFVPEGFPEIEEPIVILPPHIQEHELKADPNWFKRAWKWIID